MDPPLVQRVFLLIAVAGQDAKGRTMRIQDFQKRKRLHGGGIVLQRADFVVRVHEHVFRHRAAFRLGRTSPFRFPLIAVSAKRFLRNTHIATNGDVVELAFANQLRNAAHGNAQKLRCLFLGKLVLHFRITSCLNSSYSVP